MSQESTTEVAELRKAVRRTQFLALASLSIAGLTVLLNAIRQPQVLKARGLVLVDEQGRDRVLLGAPTPNSANRVRRDAASASLIFLNERGYDQVVVGEGPAPQMNGKSEQRNSAGWGLLFNDAVGNERGGIGFASMGRASMALDRSDGDAVGMMVDDRSGYVGFGINYPGQQTALEFAVTNGHLAAGFLDPEGRQRANLKILGSEKPTWVLHDAISAPKDPD